MFGIFSPIKNHCPATPGFNIFILEGGNGSVERAGCEQLLSQQRTKIGQKAKNLKGNELPTSGPAIWQELQAHSNKQINGSSNYNNNRTTG